MNNNKNYGQMYADKIRDDLNEKICLSSKYLGGGIVSLSFKDLTGKIADFEINGNRIGWAASVIKIPVMMEVFNQAAKGIISLEDRVEVDRRYTLEKNDFISGMPAGRKLDLWTLMYFMMVHSDNEATNMLAGKVGLENINKTCYELGAKRTMLGHLLLPNVPRFKSEFNPDGSNVTTPNDMNHLLSLIYQKKIFTKEYCKEMIHLLENTLQNFLGEQLPLNTRVGNKVGFISDPESGEDIHDVGVINRSYAVSIMLNKVRADEIRKRKDYLASPIIAIPANLGQLPPQIFMEPRKPFALPIIEDNCNILGFEFTLIGSLSKMIYEAYYKKAQIQGGAL